MIALTVVNYGYPIAQLALAEGGVGARDSDREPLMQDARHVRLAQPVGSLERRLARGAHRCCRCSWASSGCLRCTATSRRKACGQASAAPPACPRSGRARRGVGRACAAGDERRARRAAWHAPAATTPSGRGATLALNCTMCHGAHGMSGSDAPNLAGQYPEVVIKQLHDYKSGKRSSSVMQALARRPFRPRHRRPGGLLRLPAEGPHRADDLRRIAAAAGARRRAACATSRPASRATAASTRSSARRGSRACRRTTWSPS